jgi:NADPH:quinone reductase-like Zn-dependent oxidoreductase
VIILRPGGPEVLQVIDEALPVPAAHEVRVKVLAAGVARADVMMRRKQYPGAVPQYPYTPGFDVAGVIDAAGRDVQRFKVGDHVAALTGKGGYAEYSCLPEHDVVSFPSHLDPGEVVCLVLNYMTAYQMLHRFARVQGGETILVHAAASGVGTALLQLGKLHGLSVIGTASSRKLDVLSGLGCIPIDYQREDFVRAVRQGKAGRVDAAFDPVGGSHLWRSFRCLRPGGRLMAYGEMAVTGPGQPERGEVFWHHNLPRWLNYLPGGRSVRWYEVLDEKVAHPDWYLADMATLIDLLAHGRVRPIIAARLPLDEVARAHRDIETAAVVGKIILNVQESKTSART